jgi:hypothetical protein
MHALYGLAWVDVGWHRADRTEALREARWALAKLDGPQGTEPFSAELTPRYGVFHAGWTNWLRGGIVRLAAGPGTARDASDRDAPARDAPARDPAARNPAARNPAGDGGTAGPGTADPADLGDPAEVERFERDSRALAAAFDAAASPFLPAYPGQSWPVDSTVAIASLRLHDAVLAPAFGGTVARWLAAARERLDPATGLLPHESDPVSGAPRQGARASSQSVIQRFLVEVDPGFAREQYARFRALFVVRPLGLGPALREYPQGTDGPGDVDSGPLPLGVSLSATVVTIGAARVQGDASLASALAEFGEVAGVPVTTPWTKRYALGLLPVGDAFLVWAHTAEPWVAPRPAPPPAVIGPLWRAPLTAGLLLLGVAARLLLGRRRREPERREQLGDRADVGGVVDAVVPERL